MVSSQPIPWYNVPAREFPVKTWLRQRYPFIVSPASVARLGAPGQVGRRRFPALVWLEARARHPSPPSRLKRAPQGYAAKPL